MQAKETETLTFFDFPIEQFPDRSTQWLLEEKENVRGLLETIADDSGGEILILAVSHISTEVSYRTICGSKHPTFCIVCCFALNRKWMKSLFIFSLNADPTLKQQLHLTCCFT